MRWPIRPLAEVAPIRSRKPEIFDGTRRYYSTGAVGKNGELDTPELVTFAERPSRANCMPKIGDVGFARMNGTQKVVLVSEAELGSLFSTGFCILEPNDALDSKYLFYFLTSEGFQSEKNALAGEGIMGGIKNSDVANMQIPLPPMSEQQRIVRLLDEALEGITVAKANAEKNLRNARAIFENHLQAVFQRGGDGWTDKALEEVCQFSNGLWKGENPPYERVGVIRNTNFTKDGTLDDSDIAFLDVEVKKLEKRRLKYGDIILEKSGGGPKQAVGRVILFEKETGSFSFSNFTAAMRVLDQKSVYHRFLHKFLFWTYISGATENMQSNSTGIRNLNGDAYKAIRFSFPSYSEQRAIAGLIDKLQENTNRLAQINVAKMAVYEELQESLLHQAFSGKLKAA